jgi:hypothetical protein
MNCLTEFHEIWYRGNVIQGDLDAIIFNPIALIISKLLGEPCSTVGLDCLHSMVTMATKLFTAVNLVKLNYIELFSDYLMMLFLLHHLHSFDC